jgi:hypothetical protein
MYCSLWLLGMKSPSPLPVWVDISPTFQNNNNTPSTYLMQSFIVVQCRCDQREMFAMCQLFAEPL